MNNLILSFNVVFPTFLIIFLGYFLRRIKLFDDKTLKVMNNVTFKSFLPILLFYNVYKTDLKEGINLKLMLFAAISIIVSFLALCIIIPLIEKENKKRGVLIQAIFRSNFVLFGLPITISLFGDECSGITAILISVIVPIFNLLAVVDLEIFRGGKINLKNIFKGIVTNPLIIASALGIISLILNIKLPKVLENTISDVSKVATPLALVILGGSFTFKSVVGYKKQLIIGCFGRLVGIPAIFIPIAVLMGFRGVELGTLLTMFCAPTAVSSYTMAEQMGGDSELAASLVVFGSSFAIITFFLWIFIVKSLGYI